MRKDVTVRCLGADETRARIGQLADLLLDCVEGGASVSFMLPMARETAVRFWQDVADGVGRGERSLLVAEDDRGIVGTVQLVTSMPENQPHRADVAKLLVHRRARGAGIGQRLMEAVEEAARGRAGGCWCSIRPARRRSGCMSGWAGSVLAWCRILRCCRMGGCVRRRFITSMSEPAADFYRPPPAITLTYTISASSSKP
jgi:GNAT superfamily N-acetyltransferase